jgi:DNA-binding Lrp family transcriptional regulator
VPQVASVTVASSGRDLYLTVLTVDLAALSDFVLAQLNRLGGVRGTRTHLVTRLFSQGNKWTLDTLDRDTRARLAARDGRPSAGGRALPESDREFLHALDDGRRTFADLAQRTGTSVATARRRLGRMIRDEMISFRCETAQPITGWPVAASFWARVPPDKLDQIARTLVSLREIRMCAAVTGSDNLVISLWLRSLADSQRFEAELARQLPAVVLTDRTITLRSAKRMGCLLDDSGRSTAVIPIDPWAPPAVELQPTERSVRSH